MGHIDYMSNLNTKDDPGRKRLYDKMIKAFGYLPVYGPSIHDVLSGQKLLSYLTAEFPGYKWVIEVRDTIVTVVNESLAPDWGFRVREKLLDNDGRTIRLMAGELLERYNVKRGPADEAALNTIDRDARGNVKRLDS